LGFFFWFVRLWWVVWRMLRVSWLRRIINRLRRLPMEGRLLDVCCLRLVSRLRLIDGEVIVRRASVGLLRLITNGLISRLCVVRRLRAPRLRN